MSWFTLLLAVWSGGPPPSHRAVDALAARLASPKFVVREAASKELAARPAAYAHALARHPDPEVRYRALSVPSRPAEDYGPLPMIDALWWDKGKEIDSVWGPVKSGTYADSSDATAAGARRRAFESYLDVRGRDGQPWGCYCEATGDLLKDLRRLGIPPGTLRVLLNEMRRRDQEFLDRHHEGKWPGRGGN